MARQVRRKKPAEAAPKGPDTRVALAALAVVVLTVLLPFLTRAFHR
jgi:hypothetical protein